MDFPLWSSSQATLSNLDFMAIKLYACRAVELELVDDRCISLETKIKTQFNELCAYWVAVNQIRYLAEYGNIITPADVERDPQICYVHILRKTFFHEAKQKYVGQILDELRNGLISKMPQLHYDRGQHKVSVSPIEYQSPRFCPSSTTDVCWPGDETPNTEPQPLDYQVFGKKKRFNKPDNFLKHTVNTGKCRNLAAHHIISQSLLQTFFNINAELKKKIGETRECPQIDNRFYNILDHSQRKILTITLWMRHCNGEPKTYQQNSPPPSFSSNFLMDDNEKFLDNLGRVYTWSLGGNIFLGPVGESRGPFDPSAKGLDFEFDAEPILGKDKYNNCLDLFKQIKRFVDLNQEQRTYEESEDIFNSIHHHYLMHEITPYNESQWVERTPTEDELNLVKKKFARNCRGKQFWAIKKVGTVEFTASTGKSSASTRKSSGPKKKVK